jgi:flagellar basal body-associated protein FliL
MEEQTEQKKSSLWIWVVVILILVAVGIGLYFWATGDSSPIAHVGNNGTGILNSATNSGNSIPSPPAFPE